MTAPVATTGHRNNFLSLGAWLVCEIVSSILFGILTIQCALYFNRFRNDNWGFKALVSVSWFLELLNQTFTLWWTYQVQVRNFGHLAAELKYGWTLGATCSVMSFNAALVQLFFARRGYLLNPSIWPLPLLSVFLAFLAFFAGMTTSIKMMIASGEFPGYEWLKKLWILSEAATDILVALVVVHSLGTRRKAAHLSTQGGLQRLIFYTMSNGLLTSILALIVFALFQFVAQLGAYPGVNLVLARIYANSLVTSLNLRGTWIQDNKTSHPTHEPAEPPQVNSASNLSINDADDGLFSSPIETLGRPS
ncbi:hypothetical protein DL93DRAFT_1564820 [Clavulina sp. PMI_390]|nr:hypothetical protein DL93DRAFT_1564820 [Clavulina sp. PMI_390]